MSTWSRHTLHVGATQAFEYKSTTDETVSHDAPNRAGDPRQQMESFAAGVQRGREEMQDQLDAERSRMAQAIRNFDRDRESYFHKVESEVVTLALAIARKILHRESQIDPLFLSGVVRLALERLNAETEFVLRVHPNRVPVWRDYFTRQADLPSLPELVGDSSIDTDHCILETALGETDLSVEAQFKEIENGLTDLLSKRP